MSTDLDEPAAAAAAVPVPVAEATALRLRSRSRAAAAQARRAARRSRRLRVALAGACVPLIAIAAVLAFSRHPGQPAPRARQDRHPRPAAVAAASAPARGRWQHIATRAADPLQLTVAQLFPARFTFGRADYLRTAGSGGSKCASAIFGAALQAAARKYGCSQVVRASYLDASQGLMGTIGVLNLATSSGAASAGKVTGGMEFIAQLTARSGPTRYLARGTGLEEAEAKGHYLILTWAEFTSLRAPQTAAERAKLRTFSSVLISQTANISLSSRMVTGSPRTP